VDKQKRVRTQAIMFGGLGVLLLAGLLVALKLMSPAAVDPTDVTPQAFFTVIDPSTAPLDVQDAAAKLATSRVGYAMVKADKTYLIISTGSLMDEVVYDRAEGQPDLVTAAFLDLHFKADAAGQSLQIGTVPLTSADTEYQFNVGETYASIPTLHNRHNLPLIPLDAVKRFSMVSPGEGAMVGSSGSLRIEGYAQVFEASFMVTITTSKGRVIGQQAVQSAAGAPSWGSFVADIPYDTSALTETGFVILDEGMTGAKITIPVRFKPASQLG
jgi:hypothetical protein